MRDLHELLTRMHEMTGGVGFTVKTCPLDHATDSYEVVVRWKKHYCDDAGHICWGSELEASAFGTDALVRALENALAENAEVESRLAAAFARPALVCPEV